MRVFSTRFYVAVVFVALIFSSCVTTAHGSLNPEKAVYTLAPVENIASTPSEGVYYCLFVRSFADSDGDGVGDFSGITAKFDYLNDGNDATTSDLGVTGIWLMPIFPSQSYHGYNVDNYYSINPDYGTMEDFELFLAEAKKRGISVIIDMTCNHSSVYTDWFQASKNPESPYRDWYRWIDGDDPRYNINQKIWGHKVWNKVQDSYYAALFESGMPDFNLSNPVVREEFEKIAAFWLDKGVDGFRFDAVSHVFSASKIPSDEESQPQAVAFWKEYVSAIKAHTPSAYTVGEVWEPTSTRAAYMEGIDSTFHFDLGTKIIDIIRTGSGGQNNLANSLYADYETYREVNQNYIDAPFLTNHDQNRISGMLKGDPAQLKLAASLYILAEGVPFIYYGEEIGLMGAKPDEQIRTPMLWNKEGKDRLQTTWIQSKYNNKTLSVKEQVKDADSILQYYKRLVRLKTGHPSLLRGRMSPIETELSEIISWRMSDVEEEALVLHNVSTEEVSISIPKEYISYPLVFATYVETKVNLDFTITIPARGSVVLAQRK